MAISDNSRVFLRTFWWAAILMFLAVGAFNALVDPFRMFGAPTIAGFNQLKPEIGTHVRMTKAFAVRLKQPHGIILGTSRADVGLDPEHPGWGRKAHPVYNLAISSGRIDEVLSYLKHAQAHGPLRQVVLSLDLMMFNANWRHEVDFDAGRLSTPEDSFPSARWLMDPLTALFSLDGLAASTDTIKAQGRSTTGSHFTNGARDTSRKWAAIQAKGGHRQVFLHQARRNLTQPDGWPLFSLDTSTGAPSPFDSLKAIAAFCQQHNIELRAFISPIHASEQEVVWQLGLGPELERWKRRLVSILSGNGIALWDFSGYNSITMEPFPPLDDHETQMKNYWEGSHYRKRVGDFILDRLFSFQQPGRTIPDDFGVLLDSSNIDAHLQAARKARAHYLSTHQKDVDEIARLVRETEAERRAIVILNRHGDEEDR